MTPETAADYQVRQTSYTASIDELVNPPAPLPDEAAARLVAAAARRKLAQRRKLSASIARGRRKASCPAADLPPASIPLPARRKVACAASIVEVPGHTAANRLKAIRAGLRELLGGASVDPAELAQPLRLFPDLLKEISRDDPFRSALALAVAEGIVRLEVENEKARRKAIRKNSNQFTRRPAPSALGCPDVI